MAIAFDATSSPTGISSGTTLSWSHTCTGSNLTLVVGITFNSSAAISGINYNSVAMTLIKAQNNSGNRCEMWQIVGPTTGAHNIDVTFGAGVNAANGGAVSFTGTENPYAGASAGQNTTSNPSLSITTTANNSFVMDSWHNISTDSGAVGGGQTQRWQVLNYAGTDNDSSGSTKSVASAGATTMSWSGGIVGAQVAVEIRQGTAVATRKLAIMGAG